MREPQMCLGPSFARSTYQFFVTGTNTPANVYENGALTTPFPITGYVQADNYGRFPPIYLDPSITYRVQFYDSTNTLRWTVDPYVPPLATTGTSSNVTVGPKIASTGEVSLAAPSSGGTGVTLTLKAGAIGSAALKVSSQLAGQPALIINSSATTGSQTATFSASNKPGTATSSPAGWLPIMCDGSIYYTPIWHGNNFTPYLAQAGVLGQTINANNITFNGNGSSTIGGSGTAVPSSWYTPNTNGAGASYYISFTKTSGQLGLTLGVGTYLTTSAPSGAAYTGGTLTTNFTGATSSTYTLQLSSGQLITGCTFTNGSPTFTCPSTSVNGTVTTSVFIGIISPTQTQNITANGLQFVTNSTGPLVGTYTISNSITGTPVLAAGSLTLSAEGYGVTNTAWNVFSPLVLNDNGTSTANGFTVNSWANQTPLAGQGANYWINITQNAGTPGYSFGTALGAWTNITSGGLSIGISGPSGNSYFVSGTYQIALDSAGVNVIGGGSITLNGGTNVQSPNWSGAPSLGLAQNGTAFLNGVGTSPWYSPATGGIGSSYWFNLTRTGGTSGVNFTNAQGSWVNIGSGLTVNISGYTGDVGTASCVGAWQISSSATGLPVLGSGTLTLSVTGLTVIHIYTSGSGTETIPIGSTTVAMEDWGGGGGGSGGRTVSGFPVSGAAGGQGAFCSTQVAVSTLGGVGKTMLYTVGTGGAGSAVIGGGGAGTASTIRNGTTSGLTTMTAGAGNGPTGGTATGGNTNVNGSNQNTTGITGSIGGDGSPYGGGGVPGAGAGNSGIAGQNGAVVFYYS